MELFLLHIQFNCFISLLFHLLSLPFKFLVLTGNFQHQLLKVEPLPSDFLVELHDKLLLFVLFLFDGDLLILELNLYLILLDPVRFVTDYLWNCSFDKQDQVLDNDDYNQKLDCISVDFRNPECVLH